jgi:Domain of unknown function (DUF1848).
MVAFAPNRIVEKVNRSRKLQAIVFWTKDPTNLVQHSGLSWICKTTPSIVQLTVTGLGGGVWEPHVPTLDKVVQATDELVKHMPVEAIRWRFDPIIATQDVLERFLLVKDKLTKTLGTIEEVTVSFPDPYKKAVQRIKESGMEWPEMQQEQKKDIIGVMAESFDVDAIAPIKLCCEPELLNLQGVGQAHCIDGRLFKKIYGLDFGELDKDPGQRAACGCVKSTDIGSYDLACPHACRYCYANPSE